MRNIVTSTYTERRTRYTNDLNVSMSDIVDDVMILLNEERPEPCPDSRWRAFTMFDGMSTVATYGETAWLIDDMDDPINDIVEMLKVQPNIMDARVEQHEDKLEGDWTITIQWKV
jgi:hypothetical protein